MVALHTNPCVGDGGNDDAVIARQITGWGLDLHLLSLVAKQNITRIVLGVISQEDRQRGQQFPPR